MLTITEQIFVPERRSVFRPGNLDNCTEPRNLYRYHPEAFFIEDRATVFHGLLPSGNLATVATPLPHDDVVIDGFMLMLIKTTIAKSGKRLRQITSFTLPQYKYIMKKRRKMRYG